MSNSEELDIDVKTLAICLKQKIEEHGGCNTLWSKIDPRFKAMEKKSIDGLKEKKKTKITQTAFKKGFDRLDKDFKIHEKMNFSIRGNPLLLMNIFEILGIRGYADLKTISFSKPDTQIMLGILDTKVDELKDKVNTMSDSMELYFKKGQRFSTSRLNTDMEAMTSRLNGIINTNNDPVFGDMIYWLDNNIIFKAFLNPNYINEQDIKKIRQEIKLYEQKKFTNKILYHKIISFEDSQVKQILFLHNLYVDFKDYSINYPLLFKYYKNLENTDHNNSNYKSEKESVCSPLYIIGLYLQIVHRFLDKLNIDDSNIEKGIIEKIVKLSSIGNKGSGNSKSSNYSIIKKYLLKRSDDANKNIGRLLKKLNHEDIKPIPSEKYLEYLEILKSIVDIYHKIFFEKIDSLDDSDLQNISHKFKNIFAIKKDEINYDFRFNNDSINQIEKCCNNIDILLKNTMRDLHG